MRRKIILSIILVLVLSIFVVPSYANQEIRVSVDEEYITFDVPPVIINGRTLVPLRAIFEELGVTTVWHSSTRTVTAKKDSITIELTIDSYEALVDGQVVELDVQGTIIDGRTIVPARFIAEALDAKVDWDAANRIVIVTSAEYLDETDLDSIDPPTKQILNSKQIGQLAESVVKIYVKDVDENYFSGSGFFYDEGEIATNYHVIKDAKLIEIEFDDGSIYTGEVEVIGYNKELDLAALSIAKETVPGLEFGDSEKIYLGQKVYAIGSPGGVINTLSSGFISAIRNQMIQINAPISQGSSGGALINEYGQVIGVTSLGILDEENLGYAIPINLFKSMDKIENLSLSEFRSAVDFLQTGETEEAYYKNLGMAMLDGEEVIYTDTFAADTSVAYVTGMLYSPLESTIIMSEWYYSEEGEEFIDSSEIETNESNAEFYFSLSKPDNGWPKGSYEVRLFINGEHQDTLKFWVE